jgi:predicted nucleotidyltransferase
MINLRSKISQKILNYFMLQDGVESYVNELARTLKVDTGNLTRKLITLEKEGILKSRWQGKQRYYSLNRTFPLLKEYKNVVTRTIGLEQVLRDSLSKVKGIKIAVIYGSYAQNKMDSHSDIDLLVVGKHSTVLLQKAVADIQKSVHREINVVSMSLEEYYRKPKTPFVMSIEKKKSIKIV